MWKKETARRLILVYLVVITGAKACYRPLPLDFYNPDNPWLLVVSGVLDPDQPVSVQVQRTAQVVQQDSNTYVDSALVELYDADGNIFVLQPQGKGFYLIDSLYPVPGMSYRVIVKYRDYPVAESDWVRVPYKPDIRFVGLDSLWTLSDLNTVSWGFDLDFLTRINKYLYVFQVVNNQSDTAYYDVDDVLQVKLSQDSVINFFAVFTFNSFFYGPLTRDTLVKFALYPEQRGIKLPQDSLLYFTISVMSVSRGYYFAYQSSTQFTGSSFNPANPYSNIHNGLGVIVAKNDTLVKAPLLLNLNYR